MKMAELRRMMKSKDKDASDTKDKSSGRKQPVKSKRRGAKGDDDDESVDSHGNIRNLIADDDDDDEDYTEGEADEEEDSFDTEETDDTHLTPEQRNVIRREARKAAIRAEDRGVK